MSARITVRQCSLEPEAPHAHRPLGSPTLPSHRTQAHPCPSLPIEPSGPSPGPVYGPRAGQCTAARPSDSSEQQAAAAARWAAAEGEELCPPAAGAGAGGSCAAAGPASGWGASACRRGARVRNRGAARRLMPRTALTPLPPPLPPPRPLLHLLHPRPRLHRPRPHPQSSSPFRRSSEEAGW